jgi:hypothetical protein
MRKNKGETDQGRPNNRPLIKAKNRFLLVFRSTRFRVMGPSLILAKRRIMQRDASLTGSLQMTLGISVQLWLRGSLPR